MSIKRLLTGDPGRTSLVYLAIGGISLAKAIALRDDRTRFRRELADAALFIGIGLALRRYATVKARKQAELESMLPDWLRGGETTAMEPTVRDRVQARLGDRPEPSTTSPREKIRSIGIK